MTSYSITVKIESRTLKTLRDDPENVLVLVRDMGRGKNLERGNIVFATYPSAKLSTTQTFTWEEKYQVYEAEKGFEAGKEVPSGTEEAPIDRGQTVTFDEDSQFKIEGQSSADGDITVLNEWKNAACIVIACVSNQGGKEVMTPHYISAPRTLGTTSALTPVQSFSVLIKSNTETKTMIDATKGITGHFRINVKETKCEVLHDTYTTPGDKTTFWTSIKNATRL